MKTEKQIFEMLEGADLLIKQLKKKGKYTKRQEIDINKRISKCKDALKFLELKYTEQEIVEQRQHLDITIHDIVMSYPKWSEAYKALSDWRKKIIFYQEYNLKELKHKLKIITFIMQ